MDSKEDDRIVRTNGGVSNIFLLRGTEGAPNANITREILLRKDFFLISCETHLQALNVLLSRAIGRRSRLPKNKVRCLRNCCETLRVNACYCTISSMCSYEKMRIKTSTNGISEVTVRHIIPGHIKCIIGWHLKIDF